MNKRDLCPSDVRGVYVCRSILPPRLSRVGTDGLG